MSSGQRVCLEVPEGGRECQSGGRGHSQYKGQRLGEKQSMCWGLTSEVALKLVLYPACSKAKRFPEKRILEKSFRELVLVDKVHTTGEGPRKEGLETEGLWPCLDAGGTNPGKRQG